jgi:monooxygenase
VVTDRIERLVPEGIRLCSGRVVEADVIVTATGLRLLAFGGIRLSVDEEPVPLPEQYVWNGAMLTGVPNFAFCLGYTNASWTLRADLTHRLVGRVLAWMAGNGCSAVVPHAQDGLTPRPLLDLTSGYVQRSLGDFPRQGDRDPWRVRQNYLLDSVTTRLTRFDRTLQPVRPG